MILCSSTEHVNNAGKLQHRRSAYKDEISTYFDVTLSQCANVLIGLHLYPSHVVQMLQATPGGNNVYLIQPIAQPRVHNASHAPLQYHDAHRDAHGQVQAEHAANADFARTVDVPQKQERSE